MSINVSSLLSSIQLVDGGYNVTNGEVVNNTSDLRAKSAEFVLKLGIRDGKRIRSRNVEFSMVTWGGTESTTVTMDNLINQASKIASSIAAISRGVILAFYMKIGKYRDDEQMPNLGGEPNNTAVLTFDNVNVEVDSGGVPVSGTMPTRKVSQTIYIPWVGEEVSLSTIRKTLEQTLDSNASLGVTRYDQNGDKSVVEAYRTQHKSYAKLLESDRISVVALRNNDEALGDSDNIISEKYNAVIAGANALPTPPEHA